jgi:hypothetical protein
MRWISSIAIQSSHITLFKKKEGADGVLINDFVCLGFLERGAVN